MITRALARLAGQEQRGNEWGNSSPPPPGSLTASGGFVNETTPLTIAAGYSCLTVISDSLSTLPIRQYQTERVNHRLVHHEVDPSQVIEQPYSEITQQDWVGQSVMTMLLTGNGYDEQISWDTRGLPTQIKPLMTRNMQVRRGPDGAVVYEYGAARKDPTKILHTRGPSLKGEIEGVSPIAYFRRSFNLGVAAERYAESFYMNSSIPSGVLVAEAGLSEDDVRLLAQSWKEAHQGYSKFAMPAVLSGVTWEQTQFSAQDAMFIDSRKMTWEEMCMIYRVPPHMIGMTEKSTSWGTGIEQQEMGFVRYTLLSWAKRIETALSSLLPPGQIVRFDFSERLRGDTLQRAQAAVLARNGGWMNVDEIRTLYFDLEPLMDGLGVDYLQPLNMVPVGSAAAEAVANAGTAGGTPNDSFTPTPPTK